MERMTPLPSWLYVQPLLCRKTWGKAPQRPPYRAPLAAAANWSRYGGFRCGIACLRNSRDTGRDARHAAPLTVLLPLDLHARPGVHPPDWEYGKAGGVHHPSGSFIRRVYSAARPSSQASPPLRRTCSGVSETVQNSLSPFPAGTGSPAGAVTAGASAICFSSR